MNMFLLMENEVVNSDIPTIFPITAMDTYNVSAPHASEPFCLLFIFRILSFEYVG